MAVQARVATAADLDAVTETITSSFMDDPLWSWLFSDADSRAAVYRRWWQPFVRGGLEHGWLWVTPACESIALWLPPGADEFTAADEATFDELITECAGTRADVVREALSLFEGAHPGNDPFFYLSLFGTHADHRGHGLGMALLAENLALIDEQHLPAYLESTNPSNLQRYRGVGFEPIGSFQLPEGGPVVTTMWRTAR